MINVANIPCIDNPGALQAELTHTYIAASWSERDRRFWCQRRRKLCVKLISDDDERVGGVLKIKAAHAAEVRDILWRKGYSEQLFARYRGSWLLLT